MPARHLAPLSPTSHSPRGAVAVLHAELHTALLLAARAARRGDSALAEAQKARAIALTGMLSMRINDELDNPLARSLIAIYRAAQDEIARHIPDGSNFDHARVWMAVLADGWATID